MKYTFSLCFLTLFIISLSAQAQTQYINTIAGNGSAGFNGDGHSAVAASLFGPLGVAVDSAGDVFIEDYYNNRVRRISATTGILTTIAGNGGSGNTGDSSYGSGAEIVPSGIAVDGKGNIFISDAGYGVIRKVNALTNIITTVAGDGIGGYSGDGGNARSAHLDNCLGLAFDLAGNLYIADAGNNVIRKMNTAGIISTFAGDDTAGYAGDTGAAIAARLDSPIAVTADYMGNVYINDFKNNVIRKVDTAGIITTFAGNTTLPAGYTGDHGAATAASLNYAQGIVCDNYGDLYIADADNNVVRKVDTLGVITTVIGNGTAGFGGDLGPVNGANLFNPYALAIDTKGHIYVADANNERVRETYSPTEAVSSVTQNRTIAVYPNPFGSQVNVSGLLQADKVGVYDVVGRQVGDVITVTQNGFNTFTLNNLTPGVYLLQVWDATGSKQATVPVTKE